MTTDQQPLQHRHHHHNTTTNGNGTSESNGNDGNTINKGHDNNETNGVGHEHKKKTRPTTSSSSSKILLKNRSWYMTCFLLKGCMEFSTLIVLAMLSLWFVSRNVHYYDSTYLSNNSIRYNEERYHSLLDDSDGDGGQQEYNLKNKNRKVFVPHNPFIKKANKIAKQRRKQHAKMLNNDHHENDNDDSSQRKGDSIFHKLGHYIQSKRRQHKLNQYCESLESEIPYSLNSLWMDIDEIVSKFPNLPISSGIYLYPRQRSIMTILIQILTAGKQLQNRLYNYEHENDNGQDQQQSRDEIQPLRICETGFAAGHLSSMLLHYSPSSELFSFDLYNRRYQNQIWKMIIEPYGKETDDRGIPGPTPRRKRYMGDSCVSVPAMYPKIHCDIIHSSSYCETDVLDSVYFHSNPCGGTILTTTAMQNSLNESITYFLNENNEEQPSGNSGNENGFDEDDFGDDNEPTHDKYGNKDGLGHWRILRDQGCISNITCYQEEQPHSIEQEYGGFGSSSNAIKHYFCIAITTGKCSKVPTTSADYDGECDGTTGRLVVPPPSAAEHVGGSSRNDDFDTIDESYFKTNHDNDNQGTNPFEDKGFIGFGNDMHNDSDDDSEDGTRGGKFSSNDDEEENDRGFGGGSSGRQPSGSNSGSGSQSRSGSGSSDGDEGYRYKKNQRNPSASQSQSGSGSGSASRSGSASQSGSQSGSASASASADGSNNDNDSRGDSREDSESEEEAGSGSGSNDDVNNSGSGSRSRSGSRSGSVRNDDNNSGSGSGSNDDNNSGSESTDDEENQKSRWDSQDRSNSKEGSNDDDSQEEGSGSGSTDESEDITTRQKFSEDSEESGERLQRNYNRKLRQRRQQTESRQEDEYRTHINRRRRELQFLMPEEGSGQHQQLQLHQQQQAQNEPVLTEKEKHQIQYSQKHQELDVLEQKEYEEQEVQAHKQNVQQQRQQVFKQTIPRDWRHVLELLLPTGSLQNDLCPSFQVPVPE